MKSRRQEREEFLAYLQACTDEQVKGVYDKERAAKRRGFAIMAWAEGVRRGFNLRDPKA